MSKESGAWEQLGRSGTTMPVVVSYHTDRFYERDAYDLARSLQQHRLDYRIEEVADLKTWDKNTGHKPSFLLRMDVLFPRRALLWLDADARVRRPPELLATPYLRGARVAFHRWQGEEVLSGTVYLGPGPGRRELLERWARCVAEKPAEKDQVALGRAVEALRITPYLLPEEYCFIYDLAAQKSRGLVGADPTRTEDVVIEHMQASRWTKRLAAYCRSCGRDARPGAAP